MTVGNQTAEVLECVRGYLVRHGYPPTLRALAALLEMSPNGVRYHLAVLERAGCIRRQPGVSRGIQVLQRAPVKTAERKPRTSRAGAIA